MSVAREQRHTRNNRCPICDGADGDLRGKGKRCSGFTSDDGEYSHCSREELAGALDQEAAGTYAHRMRGPCNCGTTHGEGAVLRDEIESTYDYTDEDGALLYQVVRKTGKRFLQRKPDGAGGWNWKLNGARRVPYRLRELLEDDSDRPVYIAEGEKDCDALIARGHTATCNPGGAGKWHTVADVAKTALQGRDIIVVADADEIGRKHARDIAASLRGVAQSVRVTEPPKPHKDVSDLLAAGGALDALAPIASETADTPPTAKGPAFKLWDAAAIWAPLEPPQYLIEPIFVRGALGLIVAYGSSLKTWVVVDGAMAVTTGEQWLLRFPTKKGRALLIDFESGDYEVRRRAQRIARGREWNVPIEGFSFTSMPEHSLASDAFFEALKPLAETHDFIAIDSLAAGSGGIDENDARFATSLNRLKSIASTTGTVIVVLHHSRKGNGEGGDEREAVRGTSAIFNAVDVVLQLRRAGDDGAFHCSQTKARGGKSVEPFIVRVEDTANDGSIVVARDGGASESADVSKALERTKRAILGVLSTEKTLSTKDAVYRRITGSKGTRVEALKELIERGTVSQHEGVFRLSSEVSQ